ncbi:hypothetical protein BC831DRAFT_475221, partial [Entophlyctis helioformis]
MSRRRHTRSRPTTCSPLAYFMLSVTFSGGSTAKAADVHKAIAFKTAKHADPNVLAGERAFWDLRCHAYCTPFL